MGPSKDQKAGPGRNTRAAAMRWRWPPEIIEPSRRPGIDPVGQREMIQSSRPTSAGASDDPLAVRFRPASLTFSAIVVLNMCVPRTSRTASRNSSRSRSRMSAPPGVVRPRSGSPSERELEGGALADPAGPGQGDRPAGPDLIGVAQQQAVPTRVGAHAVQPDQPPAAFGLGCSGLRMGTGRSDTSSMRSAASSVASITAAAWLSGVIASKEAIAAEPGRPATRRSAHPNGQPESRRR